MVSVSVFPETRTMKTYPRPTGRFVQRPKRMLEKPATAEVAIMRSCLTSSLPSGDQSTNKGLKDIAQTLIAFHPGIHVLAGALGGPRFLAGAVVPGLGEDESLETVSSSGHPGCVMGSSSHTLTAMIYDIVAKVVIPARISVEK